MTKNELADRGTFTLAVFDRWRVVSSIALVFGALVGLLGLVWVLLLCITGWKPKGLRNFTRILIGVGLFALISFNIMVPVALHPIEAFGTWLVYLVLPVLGSGYFLRRQRDYIGFSRMRADSSRRELPMRKTG